MKRILAIFLLVLAIVISSFTITSCGDTGASGGLVPCTTHTDEDNNDKCDVCQTSVVVLLDFYAINDIHGKFCDSDTQPGVDELATYLKERGEQDDNTIFLSTGDTWQGTAESNLSTGFILTEWMNEMNFVSMTIGNHEYDWGADAIKANAEIAEFPFLAINIYDLSTGQRVDYCQPSVLIERGGIQIGIIGAIGDCYSSISADMVSGVEFKVGRELTALVKAESERLREEGADVIVYTIHDGHDKGSTAGDLITNAKLSAYYDVSLSNGYVDLCFEAHTHKSYIYRDAYTVYHLQGGGDNKGISHAELKVNTANGKKSVSEADIIRNSEYSGYADDSATEALEDKYSEVIEKANEALGTVSTYQSSYDIANTVAELYLKAGLERWGSEYDIFLGGGYIKTRSPYDLAAGVAKYADVLSLLPFNNRLVLCEVSGYKLMSQFLETTNTDYHIAVSEYGNKTNVSESATYYVIVDTYSAFYEPNGLTIVDYYDADVYARDLLASEIKSGGFDTNGSSSGDSSYIESSASNPITDISLLIEIGEALVAGEQTTCWYYVQGTVKTAPDATYGNLTLVDTAGNEIYVYGLYDQAGNRYNSMSEKPVAGDKIIVYAPLLNYKGSNSTKLELLDATLIKIV